MGLVFFSTEERLGQASELRGGPRRSDAHWLAQGTPGWPLPWCGLVPAQSSTLLARGFSAHGLKIPDI